MNLFLGIIGGIISIVMVVLATLLLYAEGERKVQESEDSHRKPIDEP